MRRLSFLFHYIEKDNVTTLEERELNLIKTKKIIIINAWDIRCPNSIKSAGQFVRKLLRPASCYVKPASDFIKSLIKHYDCLIGIHARRGDYKNYLGGKHFHSWESYQNWIMEVKNVLEKQAHKKIGFILCSDDTIPTWIKNDSSIHFTGTNHIMIDLYTLILCDYNIGPPSSFGTWISWYGNVPRLIINKNTKIDSLDDFIIYKAC